MYDGSSATAVFAELSAASNAPAPMATRCGTARTLLSRLASVRRPPMRAAQAAPMQLGVRA